MEEKKRKLREKVNRQANKNSGSRLGMDFVYLENVFYMGYFNYILTIFSQLFTLHFTCKSLEE